MCLCVSITLFGFLTVSAGPEGGGAGEPAAGNPLMSTIIMIALFGLMMYFFLYRPQKKQERTVNAMRNSLQVGDEISTTGGVLGKIIQIKDEFIIIETGNDRTKLKLAKWSVRAVEHREEEEEEEDDDE